MKMPVRNQISEFMPMVIVFSDDELPYEEEILRNPYSVKHWLRYIDHKKQSPNLIYERALKQLPGSYKLWYNYLLIRRQQVKSKCLLDPDFEAVNNCFERSLVFMHKMPRIWMDYCQFLTDQNKITRTRKVFDRALRALPVTQHHRIWPLYLKFVSKHDIPETSVRVFRRYLKLFPENREEFVEFLQKIDRLDEASVILAKCVNNDNFISRNGKSKHQLWNELCELMSNNPQKILTLNVDAIIRGGLRRYTDQLGHLWTSLANYYVRSGLFDRARDIFEEAIQTVTTVRDFTQVFDAYAQFEELSLSKQMEEVAKIAEPTDDDNVDLELRLARFEHLMERRLLLLNSVLLRQNPHNVQEWHKRVQLYDGQPHEIINTYTEAVQTVQPKLAVGKLHSLWIAFAKFYEQNSQCEDARLIFEKATEVEYIKVDDLATVWCERVELEIRQENYEEALKLMYRATAMPKRKVAYFDEKESVQARLYKSLKIWAMYADLEESFGTFKSCKAVYDRILDLKIATPQIIINYGMFLEENNYFEEAFRAYEKGISLFKWPNVYDIWNTYLTKFLKRYKGDKIERARDLFEQCLETCPEAYCKNLYLLYAKLEEDYGMAHHAMAVYERATQAVSQDSMLEIFNIYIKKASSIYGIPKTRQIYEKAISVLPEKDIRDVCLRFADMETKLGEIDRARGVYSHCSQICDPRITGEFWQTWKEFEVKHGNEETMREMLRIKRSVQATYNTQVNMMSVQMLGSSSPLGTTADLAPGEKDGMRLLEVRAAEMASSSGAQKSATSGIMFVRGETQGGKKDKVVNPDEIDIDADGGEDEDGEDDEDPEPLLEQIEVPQEVFGSLKKPD
ncbi:unnamed protein product [Ceutorhynchus assimilis]|uniref:Pre-mRNA-splicing factor SYF1 n=1 Tax=Ceutorhynchus assimilis TaxID=467358 RepID=A0A9N9Q883_9CUCU|nr:unnamed protein product [Ceutorhynchus assimilis]